MSILGSWIVTIAFFFVVFLVGKLLQVKERRERLMSRATESLRRLEHAPEEPSVYGTRFGGPTQYERRSRTTP
jgi:hypothetical protein